MCCFFACLICCRSSCLVIGCGSGFLCLVELDGSFEGGVVVVDVLDVVVHLEHVVDDAAVDGVFEETLGLDYHVVATLYALGVGIADELVDESLTAQMFFEFGRCSEGV